MTKLTDTQATILSAVSQRDGHIVLPLPDSLRGGAAAKAIGAMLSKGFIQEVDAVLRDGEPVWRETGDGHGVTLVATTAGLAAIGIETDSAPVKPTEDAVPRTRALRAGTKQAALIVMLRAPEGGTIAEIMAATGWQSHTVRGVMSGALKKRLGLVITSEVIVGRGRAYKISDI